MTGLTKQMFVDQLQFCLTLLHLTSCQQSVEVGGVEEKKFGDANKNGSFARLRGRLKVSLC